MNLRKIIENAITIHDINIDTPASGQDGYTLVWNESANKFEWVENTLGAHAINDTNVHIGLSGTGIEDNFMAIDTNGLPKDSGKSASDFHSITEQQRFGWRIDPTANGLVDLLGWYIQTNTGDSLTNTTPITANEPGYHTHFVLDVSLAVGVPFNITITGQSINEASGVTTPGDTEIISVTGNGYYQTMKSWLDAVVFSVGIGKSCTIDVYRTTYWDKGNSNFTLTGSRMEWTPDANVWSIRLEILKINTDGSIIIIDDVTFANTDAIPRAEKLKPGKYKRTDYNQPINGAGAEGIIIRATQNNMRNFYVEVKYNGTF